MAGEENPPLPTLVLAVLSLTGKIFALQLLALRQLLYFTLQV